MRTSGSPDGHLVCRAAAAAGRLAGCAHRDQSGTISILSVFAALALTMLLGMVMNVGRQVDGKIRMQNAADAAAYSSGLVLARGLNSLAFTNHLLCEVFAMTAFMRVAHDRSAEQFVPEILEAWKNGALVFARSGFPKFEALAAAIPPKAQAEQDLVTAFGNWAAALAGDEQNGGAWPLMETVLREGMITEYQRAVVAAIPDMAQHAAMTAAGKNGQPDYGRGPMSGVLWQASAGQPLDANYLASIVADPNRGGADPSARSLAQSQRNPLAYQYLAQWNSQVLGFFDYGAKMSQFAQLWRHFSGCQLESLVAEYSDSNLPLVIREQLLPGRTLDRYETQMDQNFTFLGVAYWGKTPELSPGLFTNSIASDAQTYAAVRVFVPTARLMWGPLVPTTDTVPLGGPPGYWTPDQPSQDPTGWAPTRQPGVATTWDLWNQHWTCQLVPATHPMVATILQTPPPASAPGQKPITPPSLGGVTSQDLQQISYH